MDSNLQQRLARRYTGTEMYGTLIMKPKEASEVETQPSADRLKDPPATTSTTHGIRWFGPIDEDAEAKEEMSEFLLSLS